MIRKPVFPRGKRLNAFAAEIMPNQKPESAMTI
jgi:hypothetical protein